VARDEVDPTKLPDPELTRLQQQALRRLTQVVDALKDAAEKMEQAQASGGGGGGGGDGESGTPGDGIPPLAQLKLLRDMQKDVNQRTEAFKKQHPDTKNLAGKDKAELESIRKDQQDVADLIDELSRPVNEPEEKEGDKP
jgi:hypothetical protein